MKKFLSIGIIISSLLVGCGDSGSGNNSTNNELFPKNATIAEPTKENAEEVAKAVIDTKTSAQAFSLNSVINENEKTVKQSIILSNLANTNFFLRTFHTIDNNILNEVINETKKCEEGGSIERNGNVDEKTGGYIDITYNNCKEDGITVNGKIHMEIKNYDSKLEAFKDYYINVLNDVTINANNTNILMFKGGNEKAHQEFINNKIKLDITYNIKEKINDKIYGLRESEWHYILNDQEFPIHIEYYNSKGDIFIDNLAKYVTVDNNYDQSKTPFIFDRYKGFISGEAIYKMKNGKVKIAIENGKYYIYLDKDGDGVFEEKESVK